MLWHILEQCLSSLGPVRTLSKASTRSKFALGSHLQSESGTHINFLRLNTVLEITELGRERVFPNSYVKTTELQIPQRIAIQVLSVQTLQQKILIILQIQLSMQLDTYLLVICQAQKLLHLIIFQIIHLKVQLVVVMCQQRQLKKLTDGQRMLFAFQKFFKN